MYKECLGIAWSIDIYQVGIVAGAADVGLVALEEWASGAFSAYICWTNGGF